MCEPKGKRAELLLPRQGIGPKIHHHTREQQVTRGSTKNILLRVFCITRRAKGYHRQQYSNQLKNSGGTAGLFPNERYSNIKRRHPLAARRRGECAVIGGLQRSRNHEDGAMEKRHLHGVYSGRAPMLLCWHVKADEQAVQFRQHCRRNVPRCHTNGIDRRLQHWSCRVGRRVDKVSGTTANLRMTPNG